MGTVVPIFTLFDQLMEAFMISPISTADVAFKRLIDSCERSLKECIAASCPALHQAWQHQFAARGKRLRMHLALESSLALGLTDHQCHTIAVACELVHQASLIHDDVLDADTHRNGKATVWHQYGAATAICLGDSLLVEAMLQIALLENLPSAVRQQLVQLFRDAIQAAAEGQIDDCNSDKITNYSYADYCTAVRKKSGALFGLPVLAAMLISQQHAIAIGVANRAYAEFGIAYQLLDDLHDRDVDQHVRMNGYWVLSRDYPTGVEAALYAAVEQHLGEAERLIASLPSSLHPSFYVVHDSLRAKLP